jgi:ribosomal protein S21
VICVQGVIRKPNENFENLMRRFNRKVQQSGSLTEAKKRQYFEKPVSKRDLRETAIRKRASITERIEEQLKKAMFAKDELTLSVLRMVKSAVKNAEIEKGHELDEAETIAVIEKQAKQRQDSIEQYKAGNRNDLADREKAELALIEAYLPEKMSDDEIRLLVKKVITDNKEADFGRVMGAAMAELKGKADGGTVQTIVKEEMGA